MSLTDGWVNFLAYVFDCAVGFSSFAGGAEQVLKCVIFPALLKTNLQMCKRKREPKNYDKKLCVGKNQIKISEGSAFVFCLLWQVTVKLSAEDVSPVLLSGLFSNVA